MSEPLSVVLRRAAEEMKRHADAIAIEEGFDGDVIGVMVEALERVVRRNLDAAIHALAFDAVADAFLDDA